MRSFISALFKKQAAILARRARVADFERIYARFRDFTMIPKEIYTANLALAQELRDVPGAVVECGVWRGGMSAGIADILGPDRDYFLFDSFEGLPPAQPIDGSSALAWQAAKDSASYFDNCRAEADYAHRAMSASAAIRFHLVKGWFNETLPEFRPPAPISILRLDGDWYDSTLACLESLAKHMSPKGIIIVDDYYTWDGCSRAVHDFLSSRKLLSRITQPLGICVLRGPFDVDSERNQVTPTL